MPRLLSDSESDEDYASAPPNRSSKWENCSPSSQTTSSAIYSSTEFFSTFRPVTNSPLIPMMPQLVQPVQFSMPNTSVATETSNELDQCLFLVMPVHKDMLSNNLCNISNMLNPGELFAQIQEFSKSQIKNSTKKYVQKSMTQSQSENEFTDTSQIEYIGGNKPDKTYKPEMNIKLTMPIVKLTKVDEVYNISGGTVSLKNMKPLGNNRSPNNSGLKESKKETTVSSRMDNLLQMRSGKIIVKNSLFMNKSKIMERKRKRLYRNEYSMQRNTRSTTKISVTSEQSKARCLLSKNNGNTGRGGKENKLIISVVKVLNTSNEEKIENERAKVAESEEIKVMGSGKRKVVEIVETQLMESEKTKVVENEEIEVVENEKTKIVENEEMEVVGNEEVKVVEDKEMKVVKRRGRKRKEMNEKVTNKAEKKISEQNEESITEVGMDKINELEVIPIVKKKRRMNDEKLISLKKTNSVTNDSMRQEQNVKEFDKTKSSSLPLPDIINLDSPIEKQLSVTNVKETTTLSDKIKGGVLDALIKKHKQTPSSKTTRKVNILRCGKYNQENCPEPTNDLDLKQQTKNQKVYIYLDEKSLRTRTIKIDVNCFPLIGGIGYAENKPNGVNPCHQTITEHNYSDTFEKNTAIEDTSDGNETANEPKIHLASSHISMENDKVNVSNADYSNCGQVQRMVQEFISDGNVTANEPETHLANVHKTTDNNKANVSNADYSNNGQVQSMIEEFTCDNNVTANEPETHLTSSYRSTDNDEANVSDADCSNCGQVQHIIQELEKHANQEAVYKTGVKCPLCIKYFASVKYVEQHLKSKHLKCERDTPDNNCDKNTSSTTNPKYKFYSCDLCNKLFTSSVFLSNHLELEHKDADCTNENADLSQDEQEVSKDIPCFHCNLKFAGAKSYLEHVNQIHKTPSQNMKDKETKQCSICNENLPTKNDFILHHYDNHRTLYPFLCLVCLTSHSKKEDMMSHVEKHKSSKNKPMTFTKFTKVTKESESTESRLQPIKKERWPPFVAVSTTEKEDNETKKELDTKGNSLSKEMTENALKKTVVDFYCGICKKEFDLQRSYDEHMFFRHDAVLEDSVVTDLLKPNANTEAKTKNLETSATSIDAVGTSLLKAALSGEPRTKIVGQTSTVDGTVTGDLLNSDINVKSGPTVIMEKILSPKDLVHTNLLKSINVKPKSQKVIEESLSPKDSVDENTLKSHDNTEHQGKNIKQTSSVETSVDNDLLKLPVNITQETKNITERKTPTLDNLVISNKSKGTVENVLEKAPPYCDSCSLDFVTDEAFIIHQYTVHKDHSQIHICDNCNKILTSVDNVNLHICDDVDLFYCKRCEIQFSCALQLSKHNIVYHFEEGGLYSCDCCKKSFLTNRMLEVHNCIDHPSNENIKTLEAIESKTEESEETSYNYLHIIPISKKGIKIKKLQEIRLCSFIKFKKYRKIMDVYLDDYRINKRVTVNTMSCYNRNYCEICKKQIAAGTFLLIHWIQEHSNAGDTCRICGNYYMKVKELEHVLSHNIDHFSEKKFDNPVAIFIKLTNEMLRAFYPSRLISILLYKTIQKRFELKKEKDCFLCSLEFCTIEDCQEHFLRSHDKMCILCNLFFVSSDFATQHKQQVHNSIQTYLWVVNKLLPYIMDILNIGSKSSVEEMICRSLARSCDHSATFDKFQEALSLAKLSDIVRSVAEYATISDEEDNGPVLIVTDEDFVKYKDNVAELASVVKPNIDMLTIEEITNLLEDYIKLTQP